MLKSSILASLSEKLSEEIKNLQPIPKLRNQWTAENKVTVSLLTLETLEIFDFKLQLDPKKLIKLDVLSKKLLPAVLDTLIRLYPEEDYLRYLAFDLKNLYQQRTLAKNLFSISDFGLLTRKKEIWEYSLTEQIFQDLDLELRNKPTLELVRMLRSKVSSGRTRLEECLWFISSFRTMKFKRKLPKEFQRHKGYRDHGSLRPYDSKAREEANREYYSSEEYFRKKKIEQELKDNIEIYRFL